MNKKWIIISIVVIASLRLFAMLGHKLADSQKFAWNKSLTDTQSRMNRLLHLPARPVARNHVAPKKLVLLAPRPSKFETAVPTAFPIRSTKPVLAAQKPIAKSNVQKGMEQAEQGRRKKRKKYLEEMVSAQNKLRQTPPMPSATPSMLTGSGASMTFGVPFLSPLIGPTNGPTPTPTPRTASGAIGGSAGGNNNQNTALLNGITNLMNSNPSQAAQELLSAYKSGQITAANYLNVVHQILTSSNASVRYYGYMLASYVPQAQSFEYLADAGTTETNAQNQSAYQQSLTFFENPNYLSIFSTVLTTSDSNVEMAGLQVVGAIMVGLENNRQNLTSTISKQLTSLQPIISKIQSSSNLSTLQQLAGQTLSLLNSLLA